MESESLTNALSLCDGVGTAQTSTSSTGILWPCARSTPCLALTTRLTAILSMSSFKVIIYINY